MENSHCIEPYLKYSTSPLLLADCVLGRRTFLCSWCMSILFPNSRPLYVLFLLSRYFLVYVFVYLFLSLLAPFDQDVTHIHPLFCSTLYSQQLLRSSTQQLGFPGGSDGKESTGNAGDLVDPWIGKVLWRRECLCTPLFLPREFHGHRSLVGYSPWGHKESDTTERLTLYILTSHSNCL